MPAQSRTTKTIILSAGKALASVSSLLATIVLVRLFSKEDFASFRQTLLVFTMLAPFIGMGLSRSIVYHMPTAAKNQRGAIILEAILPLFLAGLVYFLFMILGGNRIAAYLFSNPKLESTLIIFAPIAMLSLTRATLAPSLIASQKVTLAAVIGVISGISVALVSTLVALYWPQLEITLFSQMLAHSSIFLICLVVFLKNFSLAKPTFSGMAKHLTFGLPLCFSSAVVVATRNVDRAMISSMCSLEQFAIFDRGAFELPLVAVITGSMTTILLVDYRPLFEQGRMDEILRLLHRSVERSALFLMPAMCFLFAFAPEFMVCMFGSRYSDSSIVFRIYLLLLPNRTIVFGSVALAAGKTKELAVASIYALLANVILNYFMIRWFGYVGGAISTLITIYFVSGYLRATIAKNALGFSMSEFLPIKTVVSMIWLSFIPLVPTFICLFLIGATEPVTKLLLGATIYFAGLLLVYWRQGHVSPSMLRRYLRRS